MRKLYVWLLNIGILLLLVGGTAFILIGAEPDWIQYDERVVGENSPSYTDVVNRPTKQIFNMFTSEHDDEGNHKAAYITALETDPVFTAISSTFVTSESDPVFTAISSTFLTAETDPIFTAISSTYVTTESDPVFVAYSSNFLNETQATWKVFYSNGSGTITALALGDANTYLMSNGAAAAPTFETVSGAGGGGAGDVISVGDCTDGACLDGSADGGTYVRLYDGDSNYAQIQTQDLNAENNIYFRNMSGVVILSGDTFTGDVTGTLDTDGSSALTIANNAVDSDELASTAVTPGSYTVASITVDTDGRLTAASSGSASGIEYALAQDQKASGTQGGTFTSGAYRTRDLNTEVYDTGNFMNITGNRVILDPGDYIFQGTAPAIGVGAHKLQLYNISLSSVAAIGSSYYSHNAATDGSIATVEGFLSITSQTTYELQHRCSTTFSTSGFGNAATFGDAEVYASIKFYKIQ